MLNLSRRSFLAAVMGAIAAPVVAPKSDDISARPWRFGTYADYVNYHYNVWDSVTVMPGEILNARLLPPPIPEQFSITSMGAGFNSDAPYESLAEVIRSCTVFLKDERLDMLRAPLFRLPANLPVPFPMAYTPRSSDFGIYLNSDDKPVRSVDPVTITISLQGFVRLSKREADARGLNRWASRLVKFW